MSKQTSDKTQRFRFRIPPAESKVVFGLAAAMLGVCAVQFDNFEVFHLLLMSVFFIAGILARKAWAIYMMLGTFVFLKYFLTAPFFKPELFALRYPDVFLVVILILLSGTCFRYLEFNRFLQAFYPNTELGEEPDPAKSNEFPSLLGGRWWVIPLSIGVATVLLVAFPVGQRFFAEASLKPPASRLIFFTLLTFFGWFICRALIGVFIRWRMDTVEADIQCRSLIAKEMWRDIYGVEKRKVKIRSRE